MFKLTRGEELTALIAVTVVGLATAAVCLIRGDRGKTVDIPLNNPGEIAVQRGGRKTKGKILVSVSGEVDRKGLYELNSGARVNDAVELAGPTGNADLGRVNLAAPLIDGEHVIVPSKKAPGRGAGLSEASASTVRVNVNEADQEQLESLPGIGPTLARRIIEFRSTRKFEKVDDLLEVQGIGPKTLEKVRDFVCVK